MGYFKNAFQPYQIKIKFCSSIAKKIKDNKTFTQYIEFKLHTLLHTHSTLYNFHPFHQVQQYFKNAFQPYQIKIKFCSSIAKKTTTSFYKNKIIIIIFYY